VEISIGDKIKELRITKRLMQSDLASQLSISNSTKSHWEKGRRLPSLTELQRIADFFYVDLSYFNTHQDVNVTMHQREPSVDTVTIDYHPIGFRLNRLSLGLYAFGIATVIVALLVHDYWDFVHIIVGLILSIIAVVLFLITEFKQWNKTGKRVMVPNTDKIVYHYKRNNSDFDTWKTLYLIWLSVSSVLTILSYALIAA
jgi:transcriptional regulator with XRE-family HTH domain